MLDERRSDTAEEVTGIGCEGGRPVGELDEVFIDGELLLFGALEKPGERVTILFGHCETSFVSVRSVDVRGHDPKVDAAVDQGELPVSSLFDVAGEGGSGG
jgi:hypothetical protein